MKDPRGQRVKVRHRNCFSVQHPSLILVDKKILCPLPLWLSSLLADKPHSRIWWLIIYQGNEMPKPRETHHWEGKGHSRLPHRYTLQHTHTFTAVMDGNNISIGACGRQSFHPYVQTALPPRAKEKEKGEKKWVMRWNLPREPRKKPSFKKPSHVRCVEPNDQ